jgi:hypothetical protein
MNALGSPRWADDSRSGSASSGTPSGPVESVLWGEDADERLLLRGLLRLHRHPVVFEAASLDELGRLPAASEPKLLVVAVRSDDEGWEKDLRSVLASHPELRPVVILPKGKGTRGTPAAPSCASVVIARPFAIRDFINALTSALNGGSPTSPRTHE